MSYVTEAADLFLSLNANVPILSPEDYLIIAEWEKQEIPLSLILKSIRDHWAGNIPMESLTILRLEVKANYAAWLNESEQGQYLAVGES